MAYTKTDWKDNDLITAEKMNKLEQGVADGQTLPAYTLPAASASALGGVKLAAAQADSVAEDADGLKTDFNALLAKLRTAGVLANS